MSDPDALRAAAARVASAAGEVSAAGALLAAMPPAPAWSGSAAVLAASRAGQLREVAEALGHSLGRVCDDVARAARTASEDQQRLQRAECRGADLLRELGRPLVAEPGPAELARRAELRRCLDGVERERADAQDGLNRAGRALAEGLRAADPTALLPAWAPAVVATASVAKHAVAAGQRALAYGTWLRRVLDPALRSTAAEAAARARFVRGRFLRLAWLERLAPGASRSVLPLTVVNGTRDAVLGGGYPGWRGTTTRVLGAAGAVAGVALLAGVAPAAAAVAGGVLTAHVLWSVGNEVYDSRHEIGAFLRRAGGVLVRATRAVSGAVREAASDAVRGVRDAVRGLAAGLRPWPGTP